MGDCYFMSNWTNYRGEIQDKDSRKDLIIASEEVSTIIENVEVLPATNEQRRLLRHMINGRYGIYFYESDLWNKEHLKQKLQELINELDKFQADGKDYDRCIKEKPRRFEKLR